MGCDVRPPIWLARCGSAIPGRCLDQARVTAGESLMKNSPVSGSVRLGLSSCVESLMLIPAGTGSRFKP